ncbi:MAG: ABC transporter permease [Desulfobacterales bacterium]
MYSFAAVIWNELRLLARDRAGLMLLFTMPAALVLVITLVQDNVFVHDGATRMTGLLVDRDGGEAARSVARFMASHDRINVIEAIDGTRIEETYAIDAVANGDYPFCVVLAPNMTESAERLAKGEIQQLFSNNKLSGPPVDGLPGEIRIYVDPAMPGGYRTAVIGALRQAIVPMQMALRMKHLEAAFRHYLQPIIAGSKPRNGISPPVQTFPSLDIDFAASSLVRINEHRTGEAARFALPTAVQQNVPAWALFGMFFIAVPLAGSLIRERKEGIFARLMIMPVSRLTLLSGKLAAYVCVSLIQFVFILMVGRWVLPMLGTSVLDMGNDRVAVALLVLFSALAAAGYGVMLGTLARTSEQATTVGPVSIVIAAALGGIMVPVFAMPKMMQAISHWSPLGWAHEAFMELMVRGGTLEAVLGNLGLLLTFFAGSLLIALLVMRNRYGNP